MTGPARRLLIITPHFPPINAPDMQRVRMSLPHYPAAGWEPVVLCVDERDQDGVREPGLLETFPASTRIVRCRALALRWTRLVGVRNLGLRSWLHLMIAGARLLRRERFDLIFISNTQFITFTLGRIWRRLYGVPYVLDVQDPWRTDYYERPGARPPPGGWKYQVARAVAWAFERWSVARASALMSVSPRYLADLRARYPELARVPAEVIPFGAAPADLAVALRHPGEPGLPRAGGTLHLVYTGASGPILPHAATVLFDAVRLYRERDPEGASRLRFHFLGTSYAAKGSGTATVLPLAVRCGVADLVTEVPHRLGHLECLRLQQAADVLMLLGSSDLAYSPSKIFPYLLTGRPVLALVFRDSVLEALLQELSGAWVIGFDEHGPKGDALARLVTYFEALLAGKTGAISRPVARDAFGRYFPDALALRQAELFNRALTAAPA